MFNKEENYIRKHLGREEHFKAPSGYFDAMPSQVMDFIKSSDEKLEMPSAVGSVASAESSMSKSDKALQVSLVRRRRARIVGIAASICAVMFSLGLFLNKSGESRDVAQDTNHTETVQQASSGYSNFDAMVDYSMIDSEDMYAYMSDAK